MHIVAITIIGILAVCVVALMIVNAYLMDEWDAAITHWGECVEKLEELLDEYENLEHAYNSLVEEKEENEMKMFSDCSGECCLCACGGGVGCLAGHGDDDFCPASKEQIIERLDKGQYKDYTLMMKNHLKHQFGYDYDSQKEEQEHAED